MVICPGTTDQWPNGSDDDGCKSGLWNPVQSTGELVDGENDGSRGDDTGQRRLDFAAGVDSSSRHGTTDTHGTEKGVEEVGDTKVTEFLTGICDIVVASCKSFGNGNVFDRGSDKGGNTATDDFADELGIWHAGIFNAAGWDLADFKEVLALGMVLVDGITDAGEEEQTDESTSDGQEPDDLVLASPFVADFLETNQENNTSQSDARGAAITGAEVVEDIMNDIGSAITNVLLSNEVLHLTKANDNGGCGDEACENWVGNKFQQKSQLEETQGHSIDTHHEGNS